MTSSTTGNLNTEPKHCLARFLQPSSLHTLSIRLRRYASRPSMPLFRDGLSPRFARVSYLLIMPASYAAFHARCSTCEPASCRRTCAGLANNCVGPGLKWGHATTAGQEAREDSPLRTTRIEQSCFEEVPRIRLP